MWADRHYVYDHYDHKDLLYMLDELICVEEDNNKLKKENEKLK